MLRTGALLLVLLVAACDPTFKCTYEDENSCPDGYTCSKDGVCEQDSTGSSSSGGVSGSSSAWPGTSQPGSTSLPGSSSAAVSSSSAQESSSSAQASSSSAVVSSSAETSSSAAGVSSSSVEASSSGAVLSSSMDASSSSGVFSSSSSAAKSSSTSGAHSSSSQASTSIMASSSSAASGSSSGGTLAVEPLYLNAVNWNDYTGGAGTGLPCDVANAKRFSDCIHGGEARKVTVPAPSCTGWTAEDDLQAFDWTCQPVGPGQVQFVTHRLREGKNLEDLLAPAAAAWEPNSVVVKENGTLRGSSPSVAWWSNPVEEWSGAHPGTDEGRIFVISSSVQTTVAMSVPRQALVVRHGVTVTQPLSGTPAVDLSGNFTWLEGSFQGVGQVSPVLGIRTGRFQVVRHAVVQNGSPGVLIQNVVAGRITGLAAFSNMGTGVVVDGCTGLRLDDILAANNGGNGLSITGSSRNVVSRVRSYNNAGSQVLMGTVGDTGGTLGSKNNVLVDLTLTGGATGGGLAFTGTGNDGNVFLRVTAALNSPNDLLLQGGSWNTLGEVAAVAASGPALLFTVGASSTTVSNLYVDGDLDLDATSGGTSQGYFTGALHVDASKCHVTAGAGTNPGLNWDGTCAAQGTSDVVVMQSPAALTAFTGMASEDTRNSSSTAGTAEYHSDLEWVIFDNPYRTWGKSWVTSDQEAAGRWTSGTGQIWDWTLKSSNNAVRGVLAAQDGMPVLRHRWFDNNGSDCTVLGGARVAGTCPVPPYTTEACPGGIPAPATVCSTMYLRHAVEILDDGVGNDNGLCEANEACVETPNFGAYQGHGTPTEASAGPFALEGVRLYRYPYNGY